MMIPGRSWSFLGAPLRSQIWVFFALSSPIASRAPSWVRKTGLKAPGSWAAPVLNVPRGLRMFARKLGLSFLVGGAAAGVPDVSVEAGAGGFDLPHPITRARAMAQPMV